MGEAGSTVRRGRQRGRWLASLAGAAAIALALGAVPAATGHPGHGPTEVAAAGNAFTGGLAFEPADVRVRVGDPVRWTNTDFLVPHTATEDHELWDLTGDYGGTPANPPGFGPGESRERRFEAGSWSYFCRVHPIEMRGTVAVPVELRAKKARRKKGKRAFAVTARWSFEKLPEGQVFDVQIRRKSGWRTVRNDTRSLKLKRKVRKGKRLEFRARVHRADDPSAASGWSPPARIRAR